jgi:hypothetical protein
MSSELYTLEVISHLPEFKGRQLRKHKLHGADYIGAYGNEIFEVVFRNNSWQRLQVRIMIDGTDVLTGQANNTYQPGKMWIVEPYQSLRLKAWPETNKGGAQFVFTNVNNSVAAHTHGDVSQRGKITAAVFTESYTYNWFYPPFYPPTYPNTPYYQWQTYSYNSNTGGNGVISSTNALNNDLTYDVSNSSNATIGATYDCLLFTDAAVGAGQQVDQKISEATGLLNPVLTETVELHYMWWNELCEALRQQNSTQPMINLGSTPRIGAPQYTAPVSSAVDYARF